MNPGVHKHSPADTHALFGPTATDLGVKEGRAPVSAAVGYLAQGRGGGKSTAKDSRSLPIGDQRGRRRKAKVQVGDTLTMFTQNLWGMAEHVAWPLCVDEGYDVVFLQETRGAEQRKHWLWKTGRMHAMHQRLGSQGVSDRRYLH